MGIFPTDVPIDTSGLNADRWHFQLSEPFNGHHVGAVLENGRSVEPIPGRILRRIAGGMGSMLLGAVRVEGGERMELGDCSWFNLAPVEAGETAEQKAAREAADKAVADAKTLTDKEAAELAELEAEIAAEEAAKADQGSTQTAAPVEAGEPSSGAAVTSTKPKPKANTK